MAINRNKNAICGIKITMPPSPGIIPSANKLVNAPLGSTCFVHSLKEAKIPSIKSMGTLDQS